MGEAVDPMVFFEWVGYVLSFSQGWIGAIVEFAEALSVVMNMTCEIQRTVIVIKNSITVLILVTTHFVLKVILLKYPVKHFRSVVP